MSPNPWSELIELLQKNHLPFDPGLTDHDVEAAETNFDFRFPPDLRAFLQTAMPTQLGFHDWRNGDPSRLQAMIDWPLKGCLFDVEQNVFWLTEWGPRPAPLRDALDIATARVREAPKLIPIFSHRYIPQEPCEAGNPIFSVYQTDIIHYGFDLDDYLRHEFHLPDRRKWPTHVRPIRFWDRVLKAGN